MHTEINPKPYIPTDSKDFDELKIVLRNQDFEGTASLPGKIAVVFNFCFIKKLTIENSENIEFEEVSIMFNNCFIGDLQIDSIVSKNISIIIHSSMFSGRVSASDLKSFSINNCILENSIFLLGVPIIDITYTTENIFPYLWERFFIKRDVVDYKPLLSQQQQYHIEAPKSLRITSSRKETDKTGIYRLRYNSKADYMVGYRLSREEESLLKPQLFIDYGTDKADIKTTIENVSLYSLSLTGNPDGKVSVENTNIGNWYLSDFSPKDEVGFYNINPRKPHDEETKIGIHKSNLDKVWFDNVYFGDYDRLSFYRSKFSNASFTSCSFPEEYKTYEKFSPIKNIHYPENRTVNHHKDQYEIFLQLKQALETTGNYYEAQKLQAISHTALNKVPSITSADKFILSINRISNYHGLSIKEPFYWFLGVSTSFYLLYLWSLGLAFQCTAFDPNLIGYYFSFVDITHRSDFLLDKNKLTGWALAIDSFHKFLIGFLIYQFVAAFRKYGKK
ncbi:MAG: hypothetical protein EOO20_02315 [Chryseobacterium sp.]|nr:MAG: hypothetical protein EOO20_02315 [Chryseobacterium sp.]